MTREEKAIMYFKDMRKKFCEDYLIGIPKDSVAYKATMAEKEFYDTAIEALEQEPKYCDRNICMANEYNGIGCDECEVQEPTDENLHREREQAYMQGYEDASKRFRQEPTKTGYWILADEQNKEDVENDNYRFICSECQCSDIHAKGTIVPYCWKCGCRMVEEQERSE